MEDLNNYDRETLVNGLIRMKRLDVYDAIKKYIAYLNSMLIDEVFLKLNQSSQEEMRQDITEEIEKWTRIGEKAANDYLGIPWGRYLEMLVIENKERSLMDKKSKKIGFQKE